jgi:hypothetical protein
LTRSRSPLGSGPERRRAPAGVAVLLVSALAVLVAAVPAGAAVAAVATVSAVSAVSTMSTGNSAQAAAQQPADDPDGDPTTDDAPLPGQDMIPEPNSGRPPRDAGDRGGALQGVVLLVIVFGVGGIAGLAVRESRRARARRLASPTAAPGADAIASDVTTDHRRRRTRGP